MIISFTPLGELFGLESPPLAFFILLVGLVGAYLIMVEIVKTWFFNRYTHLLEHGFTAKRAQPPSRI